MSYGEESNEHVYLVMIEEGECACPADQYQQKCKHRVAVEANPTVLNAGSASVEEMREARQ